MFSAFQGNAQPAFSQNAFQGDWGNFTNKSIYGNPEMEHICNDMPCLRKLSREIYYPERFLKPLIFRVFQHGFRDNIYYDDLLMVHKYDVEMINGIVQLIFEVVVSESSSILVASERYPATLVKSKLLNLNYSHIEYVLECLHKNTTKVQNIKKYLLAAHFNAPSTVDGYYQAEVNHDMPQFAINH